MSTRIFLNVMNVMAWRKLLDDFGAPQATATASAVKGCAYTHRQTESNHTNITKKDIVPISGEITSLK